MSMSCCCIDKDNVQRSVVIIDDSILLAGSQNALPQDLETLRNNRYVFRYFLETILGLRVKSLSNIPTVPDLTFGGPSQMSGWRFLVQNK